jgi:hypothetical protein
MIDAKKLAEDLAAATPGPWQLEELVTVEMNGDETMDGVEVTSGRVSIHDHALGYDDGPVDAAIHANAGLIAQAPDIAQAYLDLLAAIEEIARQKKSTELDNEYEVECADFEDGYDACIDTARVGAPQEKKE